MRTTKRFVSFLLMVVMLCSVMPFSVVLADSTYTINGVKVRADDFSSSRNECVKYAIDVYEKIWGGSNLPDKYFGQKINMLRELTTEELTLTEEHLREYVSNAALGSVLRICDYEYLYSHDQWGHSQIIVYKDANGFTVFEGGLSASPHRREHYYTWSEYINTNWLGGNYEYIKYIKWPGAPAYQSNALIKETLPAYCTIVATAGTSSMSLPCSQATDASSEYLRDISAGEKLTAIALVLNSAGNYWYQLQTSDGSEAYVPSSKMEFVNTETDDITIDNVKAPSELKQGNTFSIGGDINATYHNLTEVSAWVYNVSSVDRELVTGGAENVNAKYYSLKNSSVDYQCLFNELLPGTYTYSVCASYIGYYAVDEKTSAYYILYNVLYDTVFTVVGEGTTECSHSYSYEVTQEPTCTETGLATYTCTKCGNMYSEQLEATDHSIFYYGTQGDCQQKIAYEIYACENCDYSYAYEYEIPGHEYGVWNPPEDPLDSVWIQYCRWCGDNRRQQVYIYTETVDGVKESYAVAYSANGFVFEIDDINGYIDGEDATICTTQSAFENSFPYWSVIIFAQKQADDIYCVLNVVQGDGTVDVLDYTIEEDCIAILVHSATSDPNESVKYPNWMSKVVALAVKPGDTLTL
ncbi:MAG: hypothetical protein IJD82_01160 [Clostridia bacterium]|nr:hypothetical protein [Clostridia bacterium]